MIPLARLSIPCALMLAPALSAQEPSPVIAAYERFHRAGDKSVDNTELGGLLLIRELGCGTCHDRDKGFAPRLARVAERVHPQRLRAIIAAPHRVKPGTTMPDLWHGVDRKQRDTEVDAIVHYLVSLQPKRFRLTATDHVAAQRGAALFDSVGCAACHDPADGKKLAGSVPLPGMANRYDFDAVRRFLEDPARMRPSGRMPSLGLNGREARDLAHYLLRGTDVPGALKYTLFHNALDSLDDADERKPVASGIADGFDPEVAKRRDNYLLRFEGFVEVPRAGQYEFSVTSDDGSRLWIDGVEVLDNDGVRRRHKPKTASGKTALVAGWHAIAVEYFQRRRNRVLTVEWKGPGVERGGIPKSALRHSLEPVAAFEPFVVDAAKARRGRELVVARRCATCHDDLARPREGKAVKPLDSLAVARSDRGCLAERPPAGAPHYRLDARQRASIRAALARLHAGWDAPPDTTMRALNCFACHKRGALGGVPEDRDPYFTSTGEDLGEEGRIPPNLTGVGDRLRPAWLRRAVAGEVRVRPYMKTRMPKFGDVLGDLAARFVAEDRRPTPLPKVTDSDEALREAGHRLMGTTGLSCIACHDFHGRKAAAMHVIDLVTTHERLHPDWVDRFLRDPNEFHPGTRMPALWPGGRGALTDVLDGSADRQIRAILRYLEDGERAKDPIGLSRVERELIVGGEAIVYRGKFRDAGWRGIGVGYPARINITFDAQEVRLAQLWRGRFLDVSPHWRSQGMGRIGPRGTEVRTLHRGAPFAVLDAPDAAWPATIGHDAGFRFRGYDLGAQRRPTFRYEFRGVAVRDTPQPIERDGVAFLRRILEFESKRPLAFSMRVAVGKRVTSAGEGSFAVDGKLTIRAVGAKARRAEGSMELLIPIEVREGTTKVVIEYAW